MKINKKFTAILILLILFSFAVSETSAASKSKKKAKTAKTETVETAESETAKKSSNAKASEPAALKAWSHENTYTDEGQSLYLKATYYSNEYVENLIQYEAEQNMWTNDEMENYKYMLLKNLNLSEAIPIHVEMYVRGIPMYAAPFDKHITMMIGKKKYSPIDYDKRFNFKIIGQRDGMIYFPRYDPDTGKAVLEGAKDLRIVFDASLSHATSGGSDILWVWDLSRDRGSISKGKAADRLEADRLIKRSNKIEDERRELQRKLDALNKEYSEVNERIDELQSN